MSKWIIDAAHSEISFKVKHLMISTVTGRFSEFEAVLSGDMSSLGNLEVNFSAKIASIDTGNAQRDAHLLSNDFFNAEEYPDMKFSSTKVTEHPSKIEVLGILTIRDVSKSVVLVGEYGGLLVDPYGNVKSGFSLATTIKRKEFGLLWDVVTETGGIMVSDDVRINLDVQFLQTSEVQNEKAIS